MGNKIPLTKGINDQWKKCEKRTRITIILIIVFVIFGIPLIMGFFFNQYMTHRVGGFDTIEELMAFYQEVPSENIIDIIYEEQSACVCFISSNNSRGYYFFYKNNAKWLPATENIQNFMIKPFMADAIFIKQTSEFYISVFYVDWKKSKNDLQIFDMYQSQFVRTKLSEPGDLRYVGYIKPEQKEYVFWVDGEQYTVKLKKYKN